MRENPTPGKRAFALLLVALLLLVTSCITMPSVTADERSVQPASDSLKSIEFIEPVVWLDGPGRLATRGVRLPVGRYELEAENEDYLYFRAPAPIQVRVLENGKPVDGRDIPGGLALAVGPKQLVDGFP